jgi:TIR domain/WD domain, G-beta repeat
MAVALEEAGLDVWWDPDIPPGSDFRVETGRALKEATAVIVVWSQYSVTRHFVIDEASVALERSVLFPALFDVVDIPLGFRQIQTVDLTRWGGKKDNAALRSLIDAVARFVRKKAGPTSDITSRSEEPPVPVSDTKFTVTGIGVRLRLFGNSILLSIFAAMGAAILTAFTLQTSSPLQATSTANFWRFVGLSAVGAFVLALLARSLTFWADGMMGVKSLTLISRPFLSILLSAMILTAPIELTWSSANLLFLDIIYDAKFSPDGTRIVAGSDDNNVKIFDATTGQLLQTLIGHSDWVCSVQYDGIGARIVSGSRDGTAKIWNAGTGEVLLTLSDHIGSVHSVAFNATGTRVVTGSDGNGIKVWDASNGNQLLTLSGHVSSVRSVVFDPTGTRIASGADDGSVMIWDVTTGKKLIAFIAHQGGVRSIDFDSDGTRIVTGSDDGSAIIWSVATGSIIATIKDIGSPVRSVSFDAADTRLLIASINSIKIFDVATRRLITTMDRYTGTTQSAAFDFPDARVVVATGGFLVDGRISVWDASTGERQLTLGHPRAMLAFIPPINRTLFGLVQSNGIVGLAKLAWQSVYLILTAFLVAALIRLPLRLFSPREKLQWVRIAVFMALTAYIVLVYVTNLPAEALLVWVVWAVLATPIIAFIRLLLAWEFRGAFAERI